MARPGIGFLILFPLIIAAYWIGLKIKHRKGKVTTQEYHKKFDDFTFKTAFFLMYLTVIAIICFFGSSLFISFLDWILHFEASQQLRLTYVVVVAIVSFFLIAVKGVYDFYFKK